MGSCFTCLHIENIEKDQPKKYLLTYPIDEPYEHKPEINWKIFNDYYNNKFNILIAY